MLAYTYIKQGKFKLLDKPKPVLPNPCDVIVRVTLGFTYIMDEFYEPTGLHHPSYELKR